MKKHEKCSIVTSKKWSLFLSFDERKRILFKNPSALKISNDELKKYLVRNNRSQNKLLTQDQTLCWKIWSRTINAPLTQCFIIIFGFINKRNNMLEENFIYWWNQCLSCVIFCLKLFLKVASCMSQHWLETIQKYCL